MSLVLAYHALSRDWPAALSVRPAYFARQLDLILERGYEPTTFTAAVEEPAPRRLAITFDDSFVSVFTVARPLLEARGAIATVFVPTSFVGASEMRWPGIGQWAPGPHARELAAMDWGQLGELRAAGWEIGSHTRTHPHLTRIPPERALEELRTSKAELEDSLGAPCVSLAYPYGDHDEGVVELASEAGYRTAGTLPGRIPPATMLRWPRIGVYHRDDERRFRRKLNPAVRALRSSPLWSLAELARSLRPDRAQGPAT